MLSLAIHCRPLESNAASIVLILLTSFLLLCAHSAPALRAFHAAGTRQTSSRHHRDPRANTFARPASQLASSTRNRPGIDSERLGVAQSRLRVAPSRLRVAPDFAPARGPAGRFSPSQHPASQPPHKSSPAPLPPTPARLSHALAPSSGLCVWTGHGIGLPNPHCPARSRRDCPWATFQGPRRARRRGRERAGERALRVRPKRAGRPSSPARRARPRRSSPPPPPSLPEERPPSTGPDSPDHGPTPGACSACHGDRLPHSAPSRSGRGKGAGP